MFLGKYNSNLIYFLSAEFVQKVVKIKCIMRIASNWSAEKSLKHSSFNISARTGFCKTYKSSYIFGVQMTMGSRVLSHSILKLEITSSGTSILLHLQAEVCALMG